MIQFLAILAWISWSCFWNWLRERERFRYQSTQWMVAVKNFGILLVAAASFYLSRK